MSPVASGEGHDVILKQIYLFVQICFGGGKRPRRKRAWKTTNRKGSFAKARKLVDLIDETPPAKEDIYGALDAFVAWELEFPIIAIKKAMAFMAEEQKWRQIIQVCGCQYNSSSVNIINGIV